MSFTRATRKKPEVLKNRWLHPPLLGNWAKEGGGVQSWCFFGYFRVTSAVAQQNFDPQKSIFSEIFFRRFFRVKTVQDYRLGAKTSEKVVFTTNWFGKNIFFKLQNFGPQQAMEALQAL